MRDRIAMRQRPVEVLQAGDIATRDINVRYSLSDWKLIRQAAAERGIPMTAWIRSHTESALKQLRETAAAT